LGGFFADEVVIPRISSSLALRDGGAILAGDAKDWGARAGAMLGVIHFLPVDKFQSVPK
jgi:hypothetical protein